jgi:two-component system, response regulator PdtaR
MNQKKIMIVEAEVIVGMDLIKKVENLGHKADSTVIRYGEDVLKAAEKVNPDLIMMNIRLKGAMDGTQAASIVKETLGTPGYFSNGIF